MTTHEDTLKQIIEVLLESNRRRIQERDKAYEEAACLRQKETRSDTHNKIVEMCYDAAYCANANPIVLSVIDSLKIANAEGTSRDVPSRDEIREYIKRF